MAEYANIRSKKFLQALTWLKNNKGVLIEGGGKHPYKVQAIDTGQSYPIPTSHREINKYVVKAFVAWLVKNDICKKNEFDEKLK